MQPHPVRFVAILYGLLLLALSGLLPSAAFADAELAPYVAVYRVEISVVNGELRTELRRTPDGYAASQVVQATGMSKLLASGKITDDSEFSVNGSLLRPARFVSNDEITRDKTRADIEFDWEKGQATGTVNGKSYVADLQGLVHDRVSIQYQLMLDLLNGDENDAYVLFDVDEQKEVSITRIGSRRVEVPAGKFEAIGIQHQSAGSKRITTLWCVRELGYLPVVIEQHRKGKLRMRATLSKFTPLAS